MSTSMRRSNLLLLGPDQALSQNQPALSLAGRCREARMRPPPHLFQRRAVEQHSRARR